MKTWYLGKFVDVNLGDRFFVGRCSSGRSYFGENATLTKTTSQHMVFTTDSGAIVKTKFNNLAATVGKANANGYWVSIGERHLESDSNLFLEEVKYWDSKNLKFVKK